jgi:lipoprotein-anchoring transpeptidase ErfK/SrfK
MLRVGSIALLGLLVSASPALAQWPWWADDVFSERRNWRSKPEPAPRERPAPDVRPSAPRVADGGARPDIELRAPEVIAFPYDYPALSIVISTTDRRLYYILPDRTAYAYPISVGREGFSWTGTESISRKQAWPDWYPPKEMRERDPKLPEKMTGGVRNPLGAMALYLGSTLYRIHGTNDVKSIGQAQSSGCFRMMNSAVLHLASLTEVGTPVTVVSALQTPAVSQVPDRAEPAAAETTPSTYQDLRNSMFGYRP